MTIRAFSFGGGVQSVAALVLAAQGRIDFPLFLFAHVGEDSEEPATLRYVRDVAAPYAAAHGLELAQVWRTWARGERAGTRAPTLYQKLLTDSTSIGIPMRMSGSGAPGTRQCTVDYKIRVINAALRARGATRDDRAVLGLGISLDEWHRMSTDDPDLVSTKVYPLIDLRLDRAACESLISRAGLPIPPKSSCWFCPFHGLDYWRRMRDQDPARFAQVIQLEETMAARRAAMGKDPVYMSRRLRPLAQVVGTATQADMFAEDLDTCESGYCMT